MVAGVSSINGSESGGTNHGEREERVNKQTEPGA